MTAEAFLDGKVALARTTPARALEVGKAAEHLVCADLILAGSTGRTMSENFLDCRVVLHCGDCLEVLSGLAENSIDSVCCDPPYHLTSIVKRFGAENAAPVKAYETAPYGGNFPHQASGGGTGAAFARMSKGFMGKQWDGGDIAFRPEVWAQVFRVLKPGGYLLAFGGTRTYHRMACAIEGAGFEVRDCCSWNYGAGLPKSHDVGKKLDVQDARCRCDHSLRGVWEPADEPGTVAGQSKPQERGAWSHCRGCGKPMVPDGLGTALKPAMELICMARKPLSEGTVAANVLEHGTGAINIDGCRVGVRERPKVTDPRRTSNTYGEIDSPGGKLLPDARWPANVIHDGSEEVTAAFPEQSSGGTPPSRPADKTRNTYGKFDGVENPDGIGSSSGNAARFFYQVKQDDQCHSINVASDAEQAFDLKSEHVVSALSDAVAASTRRLALENQSYRAQNMTVSARNFGLMRASVIEVIQNLERRCSLGLEQESITARLGPVICAATRKPTGITTIILSLWKSARCAEVATFDIIGPSAEAGGEVFASRLFYSAKADADDRIGSKHPTVKPVDLMQYLVRLVTPKGGIVLDPFAGTGTTGEAAWREGMRAVLIEREAEYQADIRRRMALCLAGPDERVRESMKARHAGKPVDAGPLFGGSEQ